MASKSKEYYDKNPKAKAKKLKYDKEYQKSKRQVANRTSRNAARNEMKKKRKVGKTQDVHHKNNNPKDNRPSNLSVISRSKNRAKKKPCKRKKK